MKTFHSCPDLVNLTWRLRLFFGCGMHFLFLLEALGSPIIDMVFLCLAPLLAHLYVWHFCVGSIICNFICLLFVMLFYTLIFGQAISVVGGEKVQISPHVHFSRLRNYASFQGRVGFFIWLFSCVWVCVSGWVCVYFKVFYIHNNAPNSNFIRFSDVGFWIKPLDMIMQSEFKQNCRF